MTKEQEIKVLESLKKDSYFAGVFTIEQINQMQNNIRRDFSLLVDVRIYTQGDIDDVRRFADNVLSNQQNRMQLLIDELAVNVGTQINKVEELEARINNVAIDLMEKHDLIPFEHNLIGTAACCKYKMKQGIPLSNVEKEFIINRLK